jgi:hypothetical protein
LITAPAIITTQFKGGAMYDIDDNVSLFGNFGIVEKPPIMDNVIYADDGSVAADPKVERFISAEAGVNFSSEKFAVKANVYNTDWKDRNLIKAVTSGQGDSGNTDVIFLTGVNQKHQGLEVEASTQVLDILSLQAVVSLGTWKFTGDADGKYQADSLDADGNVSGITLSEDYSYALNGLYVGDMPQTSYAFGATLTPLKGLKVSALYNIYDNNYSDWDAEDREVDGEADDAQVWKAPGYSKLDVHASYALPISGYDVSVFAHLFNALDATYVQDASDNSQYNGFGDGNHLAHNAEVFLGTPRYFNVGLSVNF